MSHKSIPEYISELNTSQLYTVVEYAEQRIKYLQEQEKTGIWQVEDRDVVLKEFKEQDYLLAVDYLQKTADMYLNQRKYSKRDLELNVKYSLVTQEEYNEIFEENL